MWGACCGWFWAAGLPLELMGGCTMWFLSWGCLWAAPAGGEPGHPALQAWLLVPSSLHQLPDVPALFPLWFPSPNLFASGRQQQRSPREHSGPDYTKSTGQTSSQGAPLWKKKQLWKSSFFRKWQEGALFPLGPSCQVFTAHCSHNIPALGCVSRPQARCSPWVPGGCCSPSVSVIWQQCQTALLSLLCGGVASNNFSPAAWLCASSIM